MKGLRWLITDVLANQIEPLVRFSSKYDALHAYLKDEEKRITRAFALPKPEDFDNYGRKKHSKELQFDKALNTWQRF